MPCGWLSIEKGALLKWAARVASGRYVNCIPFHPLLDVSHQMLLGAARRQLTAILQAVLVGCLGLETSARGL